MRIRNRPDSFEFIGSQHVIALHKLAEASRKRFQRARKALQLIPDDAIGFKGQNAIRETVFALRRIPVAVEYEAISLSPGKDEFDFPEETNGPHVISTSKGWKIPDDEDLEVPKWEVLGGLPGNVPNSETKSAFEEAGLNPEEVQDLPPSIIYALNSEHQGGRAVGVHTHQRLRDILESIVRRKNESIREAAQFKVRELENLANGELELDSPTE